MTTALLRAGERLRGPWGLALYTLVVFLLLLGQWQPLVFTPLSPEPWVLILSEAAAGKHRFGTDLVFTSGPLSEVYSRFFNPTTFVGVMMTVYALAAVQAVILAALAARSRSLFLSLLLLSSLYFIVSRDVLLTLTPLLAALVGLGQPTERRSMILSIVGAVASGVATLAKFSVFPVSIALFLLVDVNRLRLRHAPLLTIAYALSFYLSFVLLAPAGSDFVASVKGSLETSSGYSAMALTGPWSDLALYGVLVAVALLMLIVVERRRIADGGAFGWNEAGQILATMLFIWIMLKAGFVRHDLHALIAFSGLSLAIIVYGLSRMPPSGLRGLTAAIIAAPVLIPGFYLHMRLAADPTMRYPLSLSLYDALLAAPREVERSVRAIISPGAWYAERMAQRQETLDALAKTSPLSSLPGSIESIADIQTALIAAGLEHRSKPTIQAYAAYTRALIERSRAFFADPRGPDFVLFDLVTMDERHPATIEGPSWPIFLSHFAPQQIAGAGVLLRRRREPIGEILTAGVSGNGQLGTPLPIAFGADPLFLSIDVRPSLLGRIADLLFKTPFLYVGVTLADGQERVYRLIPAIAREGFLATPLLPTAHDYALLAAGVSAESIQPVRALRVFTRGGGPFYFSQFTYTVRRIDRKLLLAGRDWSLPPDQAVGLVRSALFADLLEANGGANPGFRIVPEGLFFHPPRRIPVKTSGAASLRVGIGMLPGSWNPGRTNGVCFRVLDSQGSKVLWERCLDPVANEADRTPPVETVVLPADTAEVVLETDCRADCGWDWAYWSEIAPQRR